MDFLTKAPKSISRINQRWYFGAPFLAEFLYRYRYIVDNKFPFVAGTGPHEGGIILVLNEEKFDALPEAEQEGVLFHEISHLIDLTAERIGTRDRNVYNVASDITINEDTDGAEVAKSTLALPSWVWKLKTLKEKGYGEYKGELISELIYEFMLQNQPKGGKGKGKGKSQSGENGEGAGEGDENEGRLDSHEYLSGGSQEDIEMGKEIVKGIMKDAEARGWGSTPEKLQKKVKSILYPQVPWERELRSEINPLFFNGNVVENTWNRRNRRGLEGVPGKRRVSAPVLCFCDVSGSTYCTPGTMEVFLGEMEGIARDRDMFLVGQFDTEVKGEPKKYKTGDCRNFVFTGGGGTCVQPIFDWMKKNKMLKCPVVVFTDGEFDFHFDTYGAKVIWCSTNVVGIPGGKNISVKIDLAAKKRR